MTDFQLYVYLVGFVFFFIGVYFHIQKKKKDISEKQKVYHTTGRSRGCQPPLRATTGQARP